MGYSSNKRGEKHLFRSHIMYEGNLLDSLVYRSLTPSTAKALPYFLRKPRQPLNRPSTYGISFVFSYKEGRKLGFGNSTFNRIIRELVEKGFIDQVEAGICFEDLKVYNKFKLSRRWEDYGKPGFKQKEWEKHDLYKNRSRS